MSLRDIMLETFKQNYKTTSAGAHRLLRSYLNGFPIVLTTTTYKEGR